MGKKSILVIEDEKEVLTLLRYNLEKEGYRVLTALTGEDGIEQARSARPDLIILDLMLPKIDGLEVCRLLKNSNPTQNIPILILTAKSSEVDQVVGLEMGASDYLTKPFSVKVLLARLKNSLRKNESRPLIKNLPLVFGDLSLDKDKISLKIKNKPVLLTKTEFKILEYLMDNPEIVISRQRLVEAVWGASAIVSDISLNMHIKSLRDKLGRQGGCLETVRGSGWRFQV